MEKAFLELVKENIGYNVKGTITTRFYDNDIIITVTTDRLYRWYKEGVRKNINVMLPSEIARWFKKDYETYILLQYFIPSKK